MLAANFLVFLYLMVLTEEQIKSDLATELRVNDTSALPPYKPITSDEKLNEVSTIKKNIMTQITRAIKESSIDCAIHIKSTQKEGLTCLSFGNPDNKSFAFNPNYEKDENDKVAVLNKQVIKWRGRRIVFNGKEYVMRDNEGVKEIYDFESYQQALTNPNVQPIKIGTLKSKPDGKYEIIRD